jgi:transcriptional regulator GlxA family with amidase domain
MGSRLDRITDWKRAALKAGYRVNELAGRASITNRQLERYFEKQERFGRSPKKWVDALRMADSRHDLRRGMSIKEVAARRGFKHVQDFTRAFERVYGVKPSDARSQKIDITKLPGRSSSTSSRHSTAEARRTEDACLLRGLKKP